MVKRGQRLALWCAPKSVIQTMAFDSSAFSVP